MEDGRVSFATGSAHSQKESSGDRMPACEHTWLIINSFHLLLLKKYCRGWGGEWNHWSEQVVMSLPGAQPG